MGDVVKEFFGALDKITDILNLGRLIFYTAAGLPPVLVLAMIVRTASMTAQGYWLQFRGDLLTCIQTWEVWLGALIAGFLVANLAYVQAISRLKSETADGDVDEDGYAFQFPKLRTGREKRAPKEEDFDYAAWLISEYYRYVEIAVYIPYGIRLALPLLVVYSIARCLLDASSPGILDTSLVALGLWTLLAALIWTVFWWEFWIPQIATPIFRTYVCALAGLTGGIKDFNEGVPPDTPDEPPNKAGAKS
jgi:hypothetical protein